MAKKYYKNEITNEVCEITGDCPSRVSEWIEVTLAEYNLLKSRKEKENQIRALKSQLAKTDYQAIKYAEGWISEEDYAPIKAQRQSLRDQINELEQELN